MNHDITHCRGNKCEIKHTCRRFIAHQELIKPEFKGMIYVPYIEPEYNILNNKCINYYRHEKI